MFNSPTEQKQNCFMSEKKNTYIVKGAFFNFLSASILTMTATQLATIVNAIIVGLFISPEALSGINALMPVCCLMSALIVLISVGTGIRIARLIGDRDMEGVHRAYASGLISVFVAGGLYSLILFLGCDSIISFLCNDDRIAPFARQYLQVFAFVPILTVIATFWNSCIEIDGRPQLVSRMVIAGSLVNVALSLLFIGVFDMGVAGSAYATLLSHVFQIGLEWFLGMRKIDTYRLQGVAWLKKCNILNEIGCNMREGFAMAISNILFAVLIFLLNSIVLNTTGTVGMNIWSICLQIMLLSVMILSGICNAGTNIGCVLMGERNIHGVSSLHSIVIRLLVFIVLPFTLLMLLAPSLFLRMFGANEEMMQAGAENIIRIFSLCLFPFALLFVRQTFFIILQYYLFGALVSVGMVISILVGVWILSVVSPADLWWGFSLSLILLNMVVVVLIWMIHLKKKGTSPFSLIPLKDEAKFWGVSLPYEEASLHKVLVDGRAFLEENQTDPLTCNHCMMILDELISNILKFASKKKKEQNYDVSIRLAEGKVILTLKDDGTPFNPTLPSNYQVEDPSEEGPIGLLMVNNMGADISYKYMYGLNVLTVII